MCILQCIDKLSVQLGLCAVQITESDKYGKRSLLTLSDSIIRMSSKLYRYFPLQQIPQQL